MVFMFPFFHSFCFCCQIFYVYICYSYSEQETRYEQINGGRDQVAGNPASCKQWNSIGRWGFPGGSDGKKKKKKAVCNTDTQVQYLGWEDLLEKGMATHSSSLAWRIPWTEEPGWLSLGLQ